MLPTHCKHCSANIAVTKNAKWGSAAAPRYSVHYHLLSSHSMRISRQHAPHALAADCGAAGAASVYLHQPGPPANRRDPKAVHLQPCGAPAAAAAAAQRRARRAQELSQPLIGPEVLLALRQRPVAASSSIGPACCAPSGVESQLPSYCGPILLLGQAGWRLTEQAQASSEMCQAPPEAWLPNWPLPCRPWAGLPFTPATSINQTPSSPARAGGSDTVHLP